MTNVSIYKKRRRFLTSLFKCLRAFPRLLFPDIWEGRIFPGLIRKQFDCRETNIGAKRIECSSGKMTDLFRTSFILGTFSVSCFFLPLCFLFLCGFVPWTFSDNWIFAYGEMSLVFFFMIKRNLRVAFTHFHNG